MSVTNHVAAPSRRTAMRFSVAALTAGLTMPAIAAPATISGTPDGALIELCDRLVASETECHLLVEYDEHAPEFGPNHGRHEQLSGDYKRLTKLIGECPPPASPAGMSAVARLALTLADRDIDGDITCNSFGEEMLVNLAGSIARGFTWPPRPGGCSMAHWAPPTSPEEIAEHDAASQARWAEAETKVQAKREAEEAEQRRLDDPANMTEEVLRSRIEFLRKMKASAARVAAPLAAEMARRGLA